MSDYLPPVTAVLLANLTGFRSGMAEARTEMAGMQGASARTGAAVSAFGKVAGVAVLALGAYSVHSASEFQKMMERLHTVGGVTQAEVDANSAAVLKLASSVGVSGTAIAEALYHPVSVGYTLAESLGQARLAAQESQITGASLDDTMYSLTSTMKAFNEQGAHAHEVQSMLHAIVSQGDMKYQDFNASIKNLMPSLAAMGISLQSGGAALAYLTDRGMKADVASTRLSMGLALMSAPTRQAAKYLSALGLSSSEVTAKTAETVQALQKAGLSTTQLSDDLRKPDGIQVALKDLVDHLKASGVSANEADAIMSKIFGGGRTDKAILSLVQNLDGPGGLAEKFDLVGKAAGNFDSSWAATQKTFAQTNDQFTHSIGNMMTGLGLILLPALAAIERGFMTLGGWIAHHKVAWAALAGIGAVLAAVLASLAVDALIAAAPFLAVAAAAAAVGAGLYEVYQNSQPVRDALAAVGEIASELWRDLKAGIDDFMFGFSDTGQMFDGLGNQWTTWGAQIRQVVDTAKQWVQTGMAGIGHALLAAQGWWQRHGQQVVSTAAEIAATVRNVLGAAVRWFAEQVHQALGFATRWWHDHGVQVRTAARTIWSTVHTSFVDILKVFQFVWPYARTIVQTAWHLIKDIVGGSISVISDTIGLFVDLISGKWGRLWHDASSLVSDSFKLIGRVIAHFAEGAGKLLIQAGKDLIHGLVGGIKGAFGDVKDALGGLTNLLPSWKGPPSKDKMLLHGAGVMVMQGFKAGLESEYSGIHASLQRFTGAVAGSAAKGVRHHHTAAEKAADAAATQARIAARHQSHVQREAMKLGLHHLYADELGLSKREQHDGKMAQKGTLSQAAAAADQRIAQQLVVRARELEKSTRGTTLHHQALNELTRAQKELATAVVLVTAAHKIALARVPHREAQTISELPRDFGTFHSLLALESRPAASQHVMLHAQFHIDGHKVFQALQPHVLKYDDRNSSNGLSRGM